MRKKSLETSNMKQPKIIYCEPNNAIGYKELTNFYIDEEIEYDKVNQRFDPNDETFKPFMKGKSKKK